MPLLDYEWNTTCTRYMQQEGHKYITIIKNSVLLNGFKIHETALYFKKIYPMLYIYEANVYQLGIEWQNLLIIHCIYFLLKPLFN